MPLLTAILAARSGFAGHRSARLHSRLFGLLLKMRRG
jgi:hypothetical protein